MRRQALLLTTMVLVLIVTSGTAIAEEAQLDQEWTTNDTAANIHNWAWGYQTARVGVTGTISKVAVLVGCCGGTEAPAGDLRVTVSSGGASSTMTVPKEAFANDDVLRWVDIPLNSPIPVQAANPASDVTITLRNTSDSSPYLWALDTKSSGGTAGGYSKGGFVGCYVEIPRFGIVDCNPTSADANFRVYVTPGPDVLAPVTYLPSAEGGFSNGPPEGSTSHFDSTSFKFYANETGSTFECKLDESNWETCTSPKAYTNLGNDSHTFQVRAIDSSGNVDPTPESRKWIVDRPPLTIPDTQINLAFGAMGSWYDGTNLTNSTIARFGFYSNSPWYYPPATFECKLDDGAFESCTSGKEYTGLSDGRHNFQVRATNSAGTDDTPATWVWVVDTTAPTVEDVSPANAAEGIALTTNVTATFSDPMDPWSVDTQLGGHSVTLTEQDSSTPVAATVNYSFASKEVTLDPSAELDPNTTYTARIEGGSAGAMGLAGNALTQDYSWTFTTAPAPDITPPTVKRVAPAENATGIAPRANVTAIFSEAMSEGSISINTFKLYKKGSTKALAATVIYEATAKQAMLNPETNLQRGTTYKAVVTTGATDIAGNALDQKAITAGNQQKVWYFTTR